MEIQKNKDTAQKDKHASRYEFDEYAEGYRDEQVKYYSSFTADSSEFFAELKIQKLAEWFPELKTKKIDILDFGCGDGGMTYFINKYLPKANVFGADPSTESIELAQKNYPNNEFKDFNGEIVPYADNSFELICVAGVFHHIPFEEHNLWLNELVRILKPGGKVVIFELNPLNPITQHIFNNHPMEKNARMLWPWYARRLFGKKGKVRTKHYYFFPSALKFLRFLEPFMFWLPFSGLYAVILEEK